MFTSSFGVTLVLKSLAVSNYRQYDNVFLLNILIFFWLRFLPSPLFQMVFWLCTYADSSSKVTKKKITKIFKKWWTAVKTKYILVFVIKHELNASSITQIQAKKKKKKPQGPYHLNTWLARQFDNHTYLFATAAVMQLYLHISRGSQAHDNTLCLPYYHFRAVTVTG